MHYAKILLSGLNGAQSDLQQDQQTHTHAHTHMEQVIYAEAQIFLFVQMIISPIQNC